MRTDTKAALLTGAALFAGIVLPGAVAHADPPSPDVVAYADTYAYAVCGVLTDYPSIGGLKGVLQGIGEDGFTAYEQGEIVALAVMNQCPEHQPLLNRFIRLYAGSGQSL